MRFDHLPKKSLLASSLRKELSQIMSHIVRLMKELLRSLKLLARKFRSPLINIPRACFKTTFRLQAMWRRKFSRAK